ncbi:MAG: hypothetical protein JXA46_04940 [Dehalococcoidales bacterium]|nr:hypothetical protein [Dehalococcoidales bacterium]
MDTGPAGPVPPASNGEVILDSTRYPRGRHRKTSLEPNKTEASEELSEKSYRLNMEGLSERKMRLFLKNYLADQGWNLNASNIPDSPIDIEARSGRRKWIIKLTGRSFHQSDPVVPFVVVLGEILQRMDDPNDKYSIALQDTQPFFRLWKRLPLLAKQRSGITALFVNPAGLVREEVV